MVYQINKQQLIVKIRMDNGPYDPTDSRQTHRIEMLLLATLHVSAWACLIKSDYNFVFLMFAYFYIVSRKDVLSITIIFYIVLLLLGMDLIFYLFVTSSWMTTEENNTVWNGLKSMHGFAIFCSVIITVLKIPLAWLLFNLKKHLESMK